MEELRAMVAALGHADVRTFIQSGNVLFRAADTPATDLAGGIERGIAERFGLDDVTVVALTAPELAAMVAANPFVQEGVDPRQLYATVLEVSPRADDAPPAGQHPDRFAVVGRCAYVHCRNGYHRTKLTNAFFERRFGTRATTRNWNTMCRLAQLAME